MVQSEALQSLQSKTQEPSASTEALIRQWLFRFGVEHNVDIAPRLPLWLEAFGAMEPATLERLFRQAITTCKFFPKVSDILAPIEESPAAQTAAELKWTEVLDFVRVHYSADLPGGISGNRRISERTMTAIRAAGGVPWIADCPGDALVWCKKAFVESYIAWETLERDQYLLPEGSPVKALISNAAACKALPAPGSKR
jgi:hypothetical protein